MEKLYDKAILFLCCTIILMSYTLSSNTAVSAIIVICLSSFAAYFNKDALNIVTYIGYVMLCLIYPDFIFFVPLLSYDLICEAYRYVSLIGCFAFIRAAIIYPIVTVSILLLLVALAYILRRRTLELTRAKQDYFKLRDDMMEKAYELRLKNQDLLEKQDYEISTATLNERNRIAREIHDTVGHLLSSSILQIGALLAISKDDAIKEHLTNIKDTLSTGMDSIRSSIHNIHEDSMDLQARLSELVRNFTCCEAILSYHVNHDFSMKAKYSILFIVKEALSNIIKHSTATQVTITISELPGLYQIIIHDNGTEKKAASGDCSGMGIQSMRERVSALDGNFYTENKEGYKIFISLPKSDKEERTSE